MENNKETWAPLVYNKFDGTVFDLSDRYMISSIGRLYNVTRKTIREGHTRPNTTKGFNQYKYFTVKVDGVTKNLRVHRAVASAFCDGYELGHDVDHRDEDIYNNDMSNLRWLPMEEHRGRVCVS